MKGRLGSRGFIKGFLVLFVLVAVAFVGISFGKPYYRYNTLRSHTKDLLMTEVGNIKTIREKVLAEAAELQVPLKESDLEVKTVREKTVRVKATWSETVDFWGYYQKKLDFVIEEEL